DDHPFTPYAPAGGKSAIIFRNDRPPQLANSLLTWACDFHGEGRRTRRVSTTLSGAVLSHVPLQARGRDGRRTPTGNDAQRPGADAQRGPLSPLHGSAGIDRGPRAAGRGRTYRKALEELAKYKGGGRRLLLQKRVAPGGRRGI